MKRPQCVQLTDPGYDWSHPQSLWIPAGALVAVCEPSPEYRAMGGLSLVYVWGREKPFCVKEPPDVVLSKFAAAQPPGEDS